LSNNKDFVVLYYLQPLLDLFLTSDHRPTALIRGVNGIQSVLSEVFIIETAIYESHYILIRTYQYSCQSETRKSGFV